MHEIVTWELAQKYFLDPTFGGALVAGQRNVFTTTTDLTGIAFLTEPRHLSPLVSRLRVETSSRTDMEWDMDYDFQSNQVNASTLLANYHIGQVTIGGGDAILQIPGQSANSNVGRPNPPVSTNFAPPWVTASSTKRGFSAAGSFGFDAEAAQLQFVSAQSTYNWDCCGVTLEYRSYSIANVRNENLFRFTFTLANMAGFGSLRRQERLVLESVAGGAVGLADNLLETANMMHYVIAFGNRARGEARIAAEPICSSWDDCSSPIPAASIPPIWLGLPIRRWEITCWRSSPILPVWRALSLRMRLLLRGSRSIPLEVVATSELDRPEYVRNDVAAMLFLQR